MKKLIIPILILSFQHSFACTCIGETTVEDDIKSSKLIFKGKVLKKEIITTYNTDTLLVKSFYKDLKNKEDYNSYEDYKEKIWGIQTLEFTIEKVEIYRGRSKFKSIKIRTGFGGGDCGFNFDIGKTYLIFANNAEYLKFSKNRLKSKRRKLKNIYETNICMRTKLFSNSKNELKKL